MKIKLSEHLKEIIIYLSIEQAGKFNDKLIHKQIDKLQIWLDIDE